MSKSSEITYTHARDKCHFQLKDNTQRFVCVNPKIICRYIVANVCQDNKVQNVFEVSGLVTADTLCFITCLVGLVAPEKVGGDYGKHHVSFHVWTRGQTAESATVLNAVHCVPVTHLS